MKEWEGRLIKVTLTYIDRDDPESGYKGSVNRTIVGILRNVEYSNQENIIKIDIDELMEDRVRTRAQYRLLTQIEFENIPTRLIAINHDWKIYIENAALYR